MQHKIKGRRLGRNSAHRKALMRNLSVALLQHEMIKTTLPKAKELRPFVEKILTISKTDNLANRRLAISILGNQAIINKLFKEIGPRVAKRNGGYTRIMKFGFRTGDKAPMAIVELVDRVIEQESEQKVDDKKSTKTKAKDSKAKDSKAKDSDSKAPKVESKTDAKKPAAKKPAAETASKAKAEVKKENKTEK